MNEPQATSTLATRQAGAWFAARGVQAGDVVALCAPDRIDVSVTTAVRRYPPPRHDYRLCGCAPPCRGHSVNTIMQNAPGSRAEGSERVGRVW
jgi:hypothetical protein